MALITINKKRKVDAYDNWDADEYVNTYYCISLGMNFEVSFGEAIYISIKIEILNIK